MGRGELRHQFVALAVVCSSDLGDVCLAAPGPPLDHKACRSRSEIERMGCPPVRRNGADAVLCGTPWHLPEQPASRRLDREVRRRRIGNRGKVDQSFLETEGQAACQMTGDDLQNRIDRKSVVWGKSVSVRVDLGGRRIIKKKKKKR